MRVWLEFALLNPQKESAGWCSKPLALPFLGQYAIDLNRLVVVEIEGWYFLEHSAVAGCPNPRPWNRNRLVTCRRHRLVPSNKLDGQLRVRVPGFASCSMPDTAAGTVL